MPYPEKLENLLSIQQAAEIWGISPATIQTALYRGAFGAYARKIGKSWVILPEGMSQWKGSPNENTPDSFGILSTQANFDGIKMALRMWNQQKITAEKALNWIELNIKELSE